MSKTRRKKHKLQVRSQSRRKRLLKTLQKLNRTNYRDKPYVIRDPVPIAKMRYLLNKDPDEALAELMSNSRPPKMHIKSKYRWVKHNPYKCNNPELAPKIIPLSEALPHFSLGSKVEVGILFDGIPLHLVNMYRVKVQYSAQIDGTYQFYAAYIAHHGRSGMLRSEGVGSNGEDRVAFTFDTGYVKELDPEQRVRFGKEPGVSMQGCFCCNPSPSIQSDHVVTILRVINGTPVAEGRFKGMCEVHYMTVPHLASHASVESAYAWTYGMSRSTMALRRGNGVLVRT